MGFYNPGFDLERPDFVPESGRFILPLCVTQDELLLIIQTVEEGGIALGLGRQGPHLAPFWQAFGFIDDPENACGDAVNPPLAPTIVEEITRTVVRTVYRDNPQLIDEIIGEDDMTRAIWQKFNGIWYAGLPCGDCGGLEWVAQGPGVAIDPATNAPLAPNDGPGTGTYFTGGNTVSSSNFTCYQDKAVAYMTDRFKQYTTYLIDLVWLAGDTLLGPVDEIFEGAAILNDIASGTGSANEVRDFTVTEINAAIDATATQDALKAAWTFDGEVNRFDLVGWVNAGAPNVVGNVPLRGFMLYWLANSIIPGYNRDLGTLAAQCEGSEIAPVPTTLEFAEGGQNYLAIQIVSSPQLLSYGVPFDTGYDPVDPHDIIVKVSATDQAGQPAAQRETVLLRRGTDPVYGIQREGVTPDQIGHVSFRTSDQVVNTLLYNQIGTTFENYKTAPVVDPSTLTGTVNFLLTGGDSNNIPTYSVYDAWVIERV